MSASSLASANACSWVVLAAASLNQSSAPLYNTLNYFTRTQSKCNHPPGIAEVPEINQWTSSTLRSSWGAVQLVVVSVERLGS